jgi:hypothetical protein
MDSRKRTKTTNDDENDHEASHTSTQVSSGQCGTIRCVPIKLRALIAPESPTSTSTSTSASSRGRRQRPPPPTADEKDALEQKKQSLLDAVLLEAYPAAGEMQKHPDAPFVMQQETPPPDVAEQSAAIKAWGPCYTYKCANWMESQLAHSYDPRRGMTNERALHYARDFVEQQAERDARRDTSSLPLHPSTCPTFKKLRSVMNRIATLRDEEIREKGREEQRAAVRFVVEQCVTVPMRCSSALFALVREPQKLKGCHRAAVDEKKRRMNADAHALITSIVLPVGDDKVLTVRRDTARAYSTTEAVLVAVDASGRARCVIHEGSGEALVMPVAFGGYSRCSEQRWDPDGPEVATLKGLGAADDVVEFLKRMGKLCGKCVICGAALSDEDSKDRGMGPTCFANVMYYCGDSSVHTSAVKQ